MSVLKEILIALGTNATVLIVLGFLARSLIQTLLAKDLKKFEIDLQNTATMQLERLKCDLKSQADISIEQLKSQLQQTTIEHQVMFSKLHEERAQKIADLYKRIVEQSLASQRYIFQLSEATRETGFRELEKGFSDLYLFAETSRIYLPEHVYGLLEKLIGEIRKLVVDVFVYGGTDSDANVAILEEKKHAFMNAVNAFEAQIPDAKKALEDEFRKLLSVEKLSLPDTTT